MSAIAPGPGLALELERGAEPRRQHVVRQILAGHTTGATLVVLRLESSTEVLARWRVVGFDVATFEPFIAGPPGASVRLVIPAVATRVALGTMIGWTDAA
ncbi:MAG: hypothetical protein ACRENJ_02610 [Candidatus Eiseniibacteriota bacterium]